jgi:2-polyprenyl-3-methyl-5-hydroxy-6-metoxy-1,4-benzoquinol methylase
MSSTVKVHLQRFMYPVPAALTHNQIPDTADRLDAMQKALEQHYFQGWRAKGSVSPRSYAWDLNNHVIDRMRHGRQRIVPWLNATAPVNGASVLEIGCGTGSFTVALAEQGANVTAVDLDEGSLEVARRRCELYRVSVDFRLANAINILEKCEVGRYQLIIFLGCLEHMTHLERIACLRLAWRRLPRNGTMAIVETPNRLWYFDSHTSLLPFYHWLPDDLAFEYSRFSSREGFNNLYRENTPKDFEHFLRRGRGAGFHEFEVAIGPARELAIHSLQEFQRPWSALRQSRADRQYRRLLRQFHPGLHSGWFEEYLNIVIRRSKREHAGADKAI